MNIIDPILLIFVSLFALRGYFKGLFRESFSLLGLIFGFMGAVRYDESLAMLLGEYWQMPLILLKAASFVGLFLLVYVLFGLVGWLLHRSAKVLFLQTVNRLGGVVVGAGKGTALLALAIFALASASLMPQGTKRIMDGSFLVPPLYQLARVIVRVGKANLLPSQEVPARERKEAGLL
ncbi:MAG: CvpA family protein [Deltaproteobacteria bacterium]|nr:CvpA family protein [Deltaproteobacteria bacterium]